MALDNSLLKQLVETRSVYPDESALSNKIVGLLSSKGYNPIIQEVEPGRNNIICEKGNGDKTISLYAHLDTVDVTEGWRHDPFTLTIEGDKAYGLGSYDMKGGMAVNLQTFFDFQPKNIKLKLFFCIDEEYISKGGHALINSEHVQDVDCILSPEPAFKHGIQGIVIGRIGRAVYTVTITHKPSHFMFYEPQHDPNLLAANIITQLKSLFNVPAENKRQFIFARTIQSEAIGMSIPEKTIIELDSSILPPETNNSILEKITTIAESAAKHFHEFTVTVDFKKRPTPFLSPYEISPENEYLQMLSETVHTVTGNQAMPYFRSSVADENIFGAAGKTVLGIGPEGDNAHAPDEWVSLSSLETLHDIYSAFCVNVDRASE